MKWSQAKRELQSLEQGEILKLLKTLFSLNAENKTVFENSLGAHGGVSLEHFKAEIAAAVNPSWKQPIDLKRGRRAISQFKKAAPDDRLSRLDLMMYFVEQAAAQTLEYGTINERFYDSMYKMLNTIVELSESIHPAKYETITARLQVLDSKTSGNIGWGICDRISDCLSELLERSGKIGLSQECAG